MEFVEKLNKPAHRPGDTTDHSNKVISFQFAARVIPKIMEECTRFDSKYFRNTSPPKKCKTRSVHGCGISRKVSCT